MRMAPERKRDAARPLTWPSMHVTMGRDEVPTWPIRLRPVSRWSRSAGSVRGGPGMTSSAADAVLDSSRKALPKRHVARGESRKAAGGGGKATVSMPEAVRERWKGASEG